MNDVREAMAAAVHPDAGWAWLDIPVSAVGAAVDKHLVRRIGLAQRRVGMRGGQVVISLDGNLPISMTTVINVIVLRRLLAVRDRHLIAVLVGHHVPVGAVSRVADDLPIVGPQDLHHAFLNEIRGQALASTHGWATVDLALTT